MSKDKQKEKPKMVKKWMTCPTCQGNGKMLTGQGCVGCDGTGKIPYWTSEK